MKPIITRKIKKTETVSKYEPLWKYLQAHGKKACKLTYDEIKHIIGFDIDHSFLTYKKEAKNYGYKVGKIYMKEETIYFYKIEKWKIQKTKWYLFSSIKK